MGDLGIVVLVIFIAIRVLIALGIGYLIFYEVRKMKRRRTEGYRETSKDANGKDVDNSSGSGD